MPSCVRCLAPPGRDAGLFAVMPARNLDTAWDERRSMTHRIGPRDLALHSSPVSVTLGLYLGLVPVLLSLGGLALALAPPLNHDVAALAQFAERWVGGEVLYVDLVDVNPPLIFLLHAIPAALARATGIDGLLAVALSVLVLLGWSVHRCARVAQPRDPAGSALLSVLVPVLLLLLPGSDFAQREHLMMILCLPYLVLAARRLEGELKPSEQAWGERVPVALAAALGFALKPHFLLMPVLVEAAILHSVGWRRALRDPGPWAMAALWLGYALLVVLAFPQYLPLVAMLLGSYDAHGGDTTLSVLFGPILSPVVLGAACCVPLAFLRGGALARVAALAVLGTLVAALIQAKGWTYHAYPVKAAAILMGARLGLDALARIAPSPREAGRAIGFAASVATAVLALSSDERPWHRLNDASPTEVALRETLRREAAGGRALVLSPHIAGVHPALNEAGVQQAMRFMSSWVLAVSYRSCPAGFHRPEAMDPAERLLFVGLAEDLVRHRPAVILVQRSVDLPECGGLEFDQLAWMAGHPVSARELTRYRPVGEVGAFRILRRMAG